MPEGDKIVAERQIDLNPCFYPESNNVSLLAGLLTRFSFSNPSQLSIDNQWFA